MNSRGLRPSHSLRALAYTLFVAIGVCACASVDTGTPEVHVIGVYEGSYPPNAGHGSSRPYQIDISVKERKRPVVLVLMSYEPVEWRFTLDEGAQVREVILSSVHPSRVTGLDPEVPILRESIGLAYKRDATYERIRKQLFERYGTEPSSFQYGYKGREFSIH
jgi:hypothetical protein